MRAHSKIVGPAGALEIVIEGADAPRALALVCHPHPLFSGTMDNKVVTTLSKAFEELDCAVARFNFRGVGDSEGVHDNGVGEVEDARAALSHLQTTFAGPLPIILAGFSFGAFIAAQLAARQPPHQLVLIGPAVSRVPLANVAPTTLVVHGESDDVVPLADVLAWARPQALPITIFPGAGHFFHGQLVTLKNVVKNACQFL